MDKDKFLEKITEIASCEDEITRRTLLTELSDGVVGVYDSVDTLNTTITSLNDNLSKVNDDLSKAQKANMDLFLKVESQKVSPPGTQVPQGTEPEKPKRSFDDLFKKEDDK